MSTIEKAIERMRRLKAQQKRNQTTSNQTTSNQTESNLKLRSLGRPKLAERHASKPLCRLDDTFLNNYGYLTFDVADNQLAEEYRAIKRPLLMHMEGKGAEIPEHANIIMVISALPGEGKTYTAMNLALSIAMEKNKTVLLVDGDMIKPALSESLGLAGEPGLTDVLLDESLAVTDVIHKTNIKNLSLIPAGTLHSHATELLSSQEMKRLCDELSQRYSDRVVIFDSPPMLLTSNARVLSHLAGQILFVAEAGKTLQHEIKEAVSQFDKDKIVGLVLNKSRRMFSDDYAYGSYGSTSIPG